MYVLKTNLTCVQSSDDVTFLGEKNIYNLVCKAQFKLHALRRIRKFLIVVKAKILDHALIDSQFNDAVSIWMFCRNTFYSKIEKTHRKTLKVIYNIDDSYNNFLLRSNYVSIYLRHLRFLVTEIFKIIPQIHPEFMRSFIKQKKLSYSLKKGPILNVPRTHSTYYGTSAVHF